MQSGQEESLGFSLEVFSHTLPSRCRYHSVNPQIHMDTGKQSLTLGRFARRKAIRDVLRGGVLLTGNGMLRNAEVHSAQMTETPLKVTSVQAYPVRLWTATDQENVPISRLIPILNGDVTSVLLHNLSVQL
mgnify:CR=1 FL=1